jgi:hypothetical protein
MLSGMDRDRFLQARAERLRLEARRLEKHVRIAAMLRDPERSPSIVKEGLKQIDLWKANELCSSDYIESLSYLLARPLLAAKVLEEHSPRAAQLRRNTPFAALLGE